MVTGKIKKIIKSQFGFIEPDEGGKDVYFRLNWVKDVPASGVVIGMPVEYESKSTSQGLQTKWVRALNEHVPSRERKPKTQTREVGQKGYHFFNPYNFVRPLPKPDNGDLLLARTQPPTHDRWIGLSGSLTCEIETQTPLFVSSSEGVEGENHKSYEIFKINDKPTIPATTMRGAIRTIFAAVTNSCFATFGDERFETRSAQLPKGLVPVRVVEISKKGAKLERLDCSKGYKQQVKPHKKHDGRPIPLMNTASIVAYDQRVLYKDPETDVLTTFNRANTDIPANLRDGDRVAALVKEKPINNGVYQHLIIQEIVPVSNAIALQETKETRKIYGYIHITGPNIERKRHEHIFFRWDDQDAQVPTWKDIPQHARLTVSEKTVQEFDKHLSEGWERHKRQIGQLDKKSKPWPVTTDDLPHPSYYLEGKRKLRKGDLLYYIPNSQIDIPLLRPVLISRQPYRFSLGDLLNNNSHLNKCEKIESLCPTCRMFGWVGEKREEQNDQVAYAGRLSFSHAYFDHSDLELVPRELAILSTPKPTTYLFYLAQPSGQPAMKYTDYNSGNARIRGRKVYRHYGKSFSWGEATRNIQSDQNRTIRQTIASNKTTTFTINFENLADVELGALLWTLELEPGMYHRLGLGKPLGLGSVSFSVKAIEFLEPQTRYLSLNNSGMIENLSGKKDYVRLFKRKMTEIYGSKFDVLDNIIDMKVLLSEPKLPHIHYPRSTQLAKDSDENFTWFLGAKERGMALSLASEDDGLLLLDRKGKVV